MNDIELQCLNESVAAVGEHHRRLQASQVTNDEKKLCKLLSTRKHADDRKDL